MVPIEGQSQRSKAVQQPTKSANAQKLWSAAPVLCGDGGRKSVAIVGKLGAHGHVERVVCTTKDFIGEPPRTTAGYRSYDGTHKRRLRFVIRARELGFSLNEIRELLRLIDERNRPCAEARDVAAVHLADVRATIADLRGMERVLKSVVAQCGDGTPPECPLIETLFQERAVN
ncbi:MerR family transcriptional regulator protein (plasmid) [Rhizobium etli 8C-3]|uniref:MerR family transcriptional regulator protein n=1 Tax=Rhizobium etli 8C-3 TaxID=538025 RepID=A0A1L5PAV5_RHIET|nr:MerR family DNA-binding protein [Rhizobium etli]APO77254.1 MerR family transcriptional regulator protein [Rhizobium etli 8C-3]